MYLVRGVVAASSTNSTDTLAVKLRFGPTTLTGTAIATAAARDVADNDVVYFEIYIQTRTVARSSSTGLDVASSVCSGICTASGAIGTAAPHAEYAVVSTANAQADQLLEVTGQWSVSSASNVCALQALDVIEIA